MRKIAVILGKTVMWAALTLLALVFTLVVAIYTPWVQRVIVAHVPSMISNPPESIIKVGDMRLRFPLDLEIDSLAVIERGDTMIGAAKARVDVAILPLLGLRVEVAEAEIRDGLFTLGTPDSVTYLKVRRADLNVKDARVSLLSGNIDVDLARLSRGSVDLTLLPDTTTKQPSDTTPLPWVINAKRLEIANLDYRMRMMPTIEDLTVHVGMAALDKGTVDMSRNDIHALSLSIDSVAAAYVYPAVTIPAPVASTPQPQPDTPSKPWTVTADHLSLTATDALYAKSGAIPHPGLDMDYLRVSDVTIRVDSFYNRAEAIKVPLRELSASERCGLRLTANGLFEMDSLMMRAHGFNLSTPASHISLSAYMGMGDLIDNPSTPLGADIDASIALSDVLKAMPTLAPMVKGLPQSENVSLTADIDGTSGRLNVSELRAEIPRHAYIALNGSVSNPFDPQRIGGSLDIDGHVTDAAFINSQLPHSPNDQMAIAIPPFTIEGSVDYAPGNVSGDLRATSAGGDLALKADWISDSESYSLDLTTDLFPVNSFLPNLGVGPVSLDIKGAGRGYDPFKPSTHLDLEANILSAQYLGEHYSDIHAQATLHGGAGNIDLVSGNPGCDLNISGQGNLQGEFLDWTFDADIRELDLRRMKVTSDSIYGSVVMNGRARLSRDFSDITADLTVDEIDWHIGDMAIAGDNLVASLISNDTLVDADIDNHDFHACFRAPLPLNDLMTRFTATSDTLMKAIRDRSVNIEALSRTMPTFDLDLTAGSDNIFSRYLSSSSAIDFNNLRIKASKDSLINLDAAINGFVLGNTQIDTITASVNQNGGYLLYNAAVRNRPGTLDDWASVDVNGYIADDNVAILLQQRNIQNETGFLVGAHVVVNDSTVTFNIAPYHPTIAYKPWTVNPDNFIAYNYLEGHLDANLTMSNQLSSLRLFTEHSPGSHEQEDVVLQASDIRIADWISFNPFAPPIDGNVSANMRFNWDKVNLNGSGTIGVADLTYGKERVGNFDLDASVTTTPGGSTHADVALMVDGVKTITASGALNDSTLQNPFLLDFSMIRFPLSVVNPFLPAGTAKLSGVLNGEMDISGDMAHPTFNGYIGFDSAQVNVTMLGTAFKFAQDKVPVKNNVVKFDNFAISAINANPLHINGTVDMREISNPEINLTLKAQEMQVVGSDRARSGADVYGKGYISLDAAAKGNLRFLDIGATLDVLAGTNVTYVMPDAQSVITSQQTEGMVKFINFSDTTEMAAADTLAIGGILMNIDAVLNVNQGSTINVDLSADGKNKVSIQGQGSLNYTQSFMNDTRLTGRFNINSGFARYTLPPLSEKRFDFKEGSYVAFNGDMLNPILNIHAVDRIKANVTQAGQNSRLVNFDVGLAVTNTLQNMNIAFNLSTDDDITVQNELQTMSPEQRANQAMNILLYGIYQGAGTKGDANLGGNMLYSFLESQLNALAAKAIKGVDLSFGIDQYNNVVNGNSSTTTSYSYQISKSLFNDRFKIVVGGNYSTDANLDENFAQNLINDISFEYLINKSGTMYVKLFRHVGFESILEGEVTQTGVGFVYKRKLNNLRNMFRFLRPRKKSTPAPVALPVEEPPITTTTPPNATDN